MNTLILSGSVSENSRSFLLCKAVEQKLIEKGSNITFIDARKINIQPGLKKKTSGMEKLANEVKRADNIIFGMGVHCYSVNDALKVLLDACFWDATGKFFGIICAAGGEKSYLSTMHLTQICMNEWRMIQLPRIVYATKKDFNENVIISNEVIERIELFSEEFYTIGRKLLT